MEKTKYCITAKLNISKQTFEHSHPTDITNELIFSFSPSGKYYANVHKSSINDVQTYIINIWNEYKKFTSYDMKLYNDALIHTKNIFGCLKWNSEENRILYISEKKIVPYKPLVDIENQIIKEKDVFNEEYLYKEGYGECLNDVIDPTLNVLNINLTSCNMDIEEIKRNSFQIKIPQHLAPASACWRPNIDGQKLETIVFIGYDKLPFKRGIIFITTRKNILCNVTFDPSNEELTTFVELDREGAFRCPGFTENGKLLIYFEDVCEGPHHTSSRIWVMDWNTKSKILIIDWSPKMDKHYPKNWPPGFNGIYNSDDLNEPAKNPGFSCYLNKETCSSISLILSSTCGFKKAIIMIKCKNLCFDGIGNPLYDPNIHTNIEILTKEFQEDGSWTFLDRKDNVLLASYSSPNTPPILKYAIIELESTGSHFLKWRDVISNDNAESPFKDINWQVIALERDIDLFNRQKLDEKPTHFECMLLMRKDQTRDIEIKTPNISNLKGLIVMPHGGPHSGFITNWMYQVAAFCMLDYAVLLINYTGSSGYGDYGIFSLLGHIGTKDVMDVQFATFHILKKYHSLIDPTRIHAYGGSHGGYVVLHLAAQFPNIYKSISCRNPVVNIPVMASISDIPEWSYVESGYEYQIKLPNVSNQENINEQMDIAKPNVENKLLSLSRMYELSPISQVDKIKCPILFLLGEQDLRVPYIQGIQMYRELKSNGINTRVYLYPDGHKLDKPKSDFDAFIRSILWFKQS
ncbi:unnamed protein product [Gordionus sp. m RMFG-2023]